MLLNHIKPEIEKTLRKNQNGLCGNWSTPSQVLTIHQIIKAVCTKNCETMLLSVDSSKAFDSIRRGKMEQILLACGLPKETVTAIMMLYKYAKAMVHLPVGDADFFKIVTGVFQAPYLFIICLDYVIWALIDLIQENGFTRKNARNKWYPAETITNCRWYSACKYICPSRIIAALPRADSKRHWFSCECK